MKERPILFSAPMVRAILEGRKTQTRRIIKPQPTEDHSSSMPWVDDGPTSSGVGRVGHSLSLGECPYGQPGDRLWVRECFARDDLNAEIYYRADYTDQEARESVAESTEKWRSPIHMPRWASRITLEIVSVRVQRLQTISEYDAKAEGAIFTPRERKVVGGIGPVGGPYKPWLAQPDQWSFVPGAGHEQSLPTAIAAFQNLWCDINGPESWAENPWVWVLEFKRVRQEPRGVVKEDVSCG